MRSKGDPTSVTKACGAPSSMTESNDPWVRMEGGKPGQTTAFLPFVRAILPGMGASVGRVPSPGRARRISGFPFSLIEAVVALRYEGAEFLL